MNGELTLKNHLKEARVEKNLSQAALAEMVGVSRKPLVRLKQVSSTLPPNLHSFYVLPLTRSLKNYSILIN